VKLRPILVKCTERHTVETVNGPLTSVTLVPDGPLNTNTGAITIFVHDLADLRAYEVGKMYRLTPDPI
jgi:phosphoribosyl-dephospho-CoA transferase